jgi:hypothetical protein
MHAVEIDFNNFSRSHTAVPECLGMLLAWLEKQVV